MRRNGLGVRIHCQCTDESCNKLFRVSLGGSQADRSGSRVDKRSVDKLIFIANNLITMRSQLQGHLSQVSSIMDCHARLTAGDLSVSADDLSTDLNEIVCNLQAAEVDVMYMMDKVRGVS